MYRATNSYKPHLSVSVINNIQSPSLKVIPESHHVRGGEVVFSGLGRPYQPSWLVLSPYIYIYIHRYIILYMLLMCIYIYTWSIYIYIYMEYINLYLIVSPIWWFISPYLVACHHIWWLKIPHFADMSSAFYLWMVARSCATIVG